MWGISPEAVDYMRENPPPLTLSSISGTSVLERRTVHIADVRQGLGSQTPATHAIGTRSALAVPLLREDAAGWFASGQREPAIVAAMQTALDMLTARLGPDMAQWTWGRLHVLTFSGSTAQ